TRPPHPGGTIRTRHPAQTGDSRQRPHRPPTHPVRAHSTPGGGAAPHYSHHQQFRDRARSRGEALTVAQLHHRSTTPLNAETGDTMPQSHMRPETLVVHAGREDLTELGVHA